MYLSLISGIISGVFFSLTSITLEGYTWWEVLLIAVVPAIVGFGLSLLIKVLVNKGLISKEQGEQLEKDATTKLNGAVEDFKDDGKINNSTEKDKGKDKGEDE